MDNFLLIPFLGQNSLSLTTEDDILKTNAKSSEYCLSLNEKDASELISADNSAVSRQERFCFEKSALLVIIDKFMKSRYICQDNYAATLCSLLEIFYEFKDETLDSFGDEEAVDLMFDAFENHCGGDTSVLESYLIDDFSVEKRLNLAGIFRPEPYTEPEDTEDDYE